MFSIHEKTVDFEKLQSAFTEDHEIAIYLKNAERDTGFAKKLVSIDNVHITEKGSPLVTFPELLMYMHACRDADINDNSYFEVIALPDVVERYADLYSGLSPNWIFRVWSMESNFVTNRRNVVLKDLRSLNVFRGTSL